MDLWTLAVYASGMLGVASLIASGVYIVMLLMECARLIRETHRRLLRLERSLTLEHEAARLRRTNVPEDATPP